jgi:ABC-2 type transport system ATP-binding protein
VTPALEVGSLVKQFGSVRAVDAVSFSVPQGQVCALLGPNGAGKTTIIHCLLGLTLPTSGNVRVLGVDLVKERSRAIEQTNFAASYTNFPWRLHVKEVLQVYADLYGVERTQPAIIEAVSLMGLEDLLDSTVQRLSSGQQTLVGLAKALINRPRVLFLDEPTASLDPEHSQSVRNALRRLASERGMTIFITSHNMVEIERISDRVLFISQGRLIADAPPSELREQFRAEDLEAVWIQVAQGARAK